MVVTMLTTIFYPTGTHQEQWCWSGMTKNGKVGFFPQSHIKPESIREATNNSFAGSIESATKSTKFFGLKRIATAASSGS